MTHGHLKRQAGCWRAKTQCLLITCLPTLLESSDDGHFLDPLYLSFSSRCSACNVLSVTGGDAMVASREGPRQIAPCMIHHRRHRPPIRGLWNAVQAGRQAGKETDGPAGTP